ncbi:MAG: glutathione S-transferase family protein [Betaproteobacteria bacterium]|nr:glutathione S-transferase family protein [Betaproteobacteria bacterium]
MIELYQFPNSTCSQKVRLVLAEKGMTYVDRTLSARGREHLSDAYLKLNPNGVVPTLVHNGQAVIDSSVINEYLEEMFPYPALVPRDAWGRARMRAWRQYIDEVPTTAIRPPSFNAFIMRAWAHIPDDEWNAHKAKLPLRRHFYEKMDRSGFPQKDITEAKEKLRQALERMQRALEDGPWLLGEQLTLADISLVPTVVRMEDIGLDPMWRDLPRVTDWYRRIQARPSFAVAYYPGARVEGSKLVEAGF